MYIYWKIFLNVKKLLLINYQYYLKFKITFVLYYYMYNFSFYLNILKKFQKNELYLNKNIFFIVFYIII